MSKKTGMLCAVIASAMAMLLAAGPASAASFEPASGTYTVDTTNLTLTGPGTNIPGSDQNGVAVFSFDNVRIPAGVSLEVEGSRPFKLLATGELALAGVIEGSGFSATGFDAGPFAGGPGGGAGGSGAANPGVGPGGGGVSPSNVNGGGGGGFGGAGARGGVDEGNLNPPGFGGAAYGDLNAVFQGGSGGGGGSIGGAVGGGGGGGGIALFGSTVRVVAGAEVFADGGSGAIGGNGASGGGSGGGILVHGDTVVVDGLLSATGGDGGEGGCCGDGGGGGGGRIAIQYRTLGMAGSTDVSGGLSGGLGSGEASTEPTGAPGVVTKIAAATASTSAATAIRGRGAILNGLVTPNSSATTYHFEYGTTTAYGSRVPAAEAPVGSDAAAHPVSQPVAGLKPNATYHFRVVATDAIGFVTAGADASFKVPACIVPKLKGKKVKAARKALKKAGCSVGKVKRSFSRKVKKGRVTKQKTKPGKVLPAGAKVGLKVSKGAKQK